MKFLSIVLALFLFCPSADAAVISSTKQKKLPTIANAYVDSDLRGFGFDIVRATTTNAYDVWGRLVDDENKLVNEWFVRSMKFRKRSEALKSAKFRGNLSDFLKFAGDGTYELTLFACPANVRKPTATACATVKETLEYTSKR